MAQLTEQPQDRIKEMKRMRIGDIEDHPDNWHIHPEFQSEGTAGSLMQVGIGKPVVAYHSERAGGKLVLIDGHDRKSLNPDAVWPVVILDIDDEEADFLLSHLDTLSKEGQIDPLKLNELLARARPKNFMAAKTVERMKGKITEQVAIAQRAQGDPTAPPKPTPSFTTMTERDRAVKVVITVDHLALIEEAIKVTGSKRRGAALETICKFYLDNQDKK